MIDASWDSFFILLLHRTSNRMKDGIRSTRLVSLRYTFHPVPDIFRNAVRAG